MAEKPTNWAVVEQTRRQLEKLFQQPVVNIYGNQVRIGSPRRENLSRDLYQTRILEGFDKIDYVFNTNIKKGQSATIPQNIPRQNNTEWINGLIQGIKTAARLYYADKPSPITHVVEKIDEPLWQQITQRLHMTKAQSRHWILQKAKQTE